MNEILRNSKLYKYFNGNSENTLFTILGFQKKILNSDIRYDVYRKLGGASRDGHRLISFCILFDHRTCRIERFLVNYGIPYNLRDIEVSPSSDLVTYKNIAFNHLAVNDSAGSLPIKEGILNINSIKDGKLSSYFILLFLLQCLYSYYKLGEYSYRGVQDIKIISHLRSSRKDDLANLEIKNNFIFNIDDTKPIKINISDRFYNSHKKDMLKLFESVELVPATFKTLPDCFKDLKILINGKVFVNNYDLQLRVNKFNLKMAEKIDKLSK